MKKILTLLLIGILISSCSNDDDSGKDNGGNTFYANFNGQTIEPEWKSGFGLNYTLYVNRYWENENSWQISVGSENDLNLTMYILNINETGTYPIETANLEDWTNGYSKTCIFLEDGVTAQFRALSLGDTGSFEVTRYESERGILEGSFSCDMYDPQHPEIIKPISGNFKINMETHPNYN